MSEELVEHFVEVVDRRQIDLQHKAVLARHAMAFDDLRQGLRQRGDVGQLARRRAHADIGCNRIAQRHRVQFQPPAPDTLFLQGLFVSGFCF